MIPISVCNMKVIRLPAYYLLIDCGVSGILVSCWYAPGDRKVLKTTGMRNPPGIDGIDVSIIKIGPAMTRRGTSKQVKLIGAITRSKRNIGVVIINFIYKNACHRAHDVNAISIEYKLHIV